MKAATCAPVTAAVTPLFQSTPPVKAATRACLAVAQGRIISIHAAREGGDVSASSTRRPPKIFQSTPPVKAATSPPRDCSRLAEFQSTPPVKAATSPPRDCSRLAEFQSTPPVKAATERKLSLASVGGLFQSTPPVKAATLWFFWWFFPCLISIHAAREGGDRKGTRIKQHTSNFNPRRP